MTQEEKVEHWIKIADNDLVVAEVMLKNKQNLYAGFMCQQAIEKLLKAYHTKVKADTPPLIHDLESLAKRSGLYDLLNDEQKDFMLELSPLNIEARYPDYKNKMAKYLTNETTKWFLTKTKELYQWIKEKI